jgi:hypothetical protein
VYIRIGKRLLHSACDYLSGKREKILFFFLTASNSVFFKSEMMNGILADNMIVSSLGRVWHMAG